MDNTLQRPDLTTDIYTRTNTHIYFRPEFDKKINDKCKHLGMRWSNAKQHWILPFSRQNWAAFLCTFYPNEAYQLLPTTQVPPLPDFLMPHQKADLETAFKKERWLFANDTGTGKTLEGIFVSKYKRAKTLVICILSNIEETWKKEYEKWAPEITTVNLWAHRNRKDFTRVMQQRQVCIINFESFKSKVHLLEKIDWDLVIVDESSKLKNPQAKNTKYIEHFCRNIPNVYLFSGSPAPNNEAEYFSQARIVDVSVFGASFYRFRNYYFYQCGYEGRKWELRPDKRDEFLANLAKLSSSVAFEAVEEHLPEQTDTIIDVTLSPAEKRAYKEMYQEAILEIEEEEISASNAIAKIMKLRQLTSGFVLKPVLDEYGEQIDTQVIHTGRTKLKVLDELLETIGDKQVIIWAQFHEDARRINEMLGSNCCMVNGLVAQADRDNNIHAFKEKQIQYIVAHPKSMGHGHNLFMSHYMVFFSFSYSHEEHKQARARIYRKGQTRGCMYYYLAVPGTVDKIVYKALTDKANMERGVLEYIRGQQPIMEEI